MKLQVGDLLFEPLSRNEGEITHIVDHPDGRIVMVRWKVEFHLPHDTEHLYSKVTKSIKKGEIQYTPKANRL